MRLLMIILCLMLMASCATLPPSQNLTSKASYVGDYFTTQFSDIIVSVPTGLAIPTGNENKPHENLHLSFSALINPKEGSLSSKYDAGDIVRRYYERLASNIVEEILSYGEVKIQDLPNLRNKILQKAQSDFDKMFSKWSHSNDFEVEIVLTSIYFSDECSTRSARQIMW